MGAAYIYGDASIVVGANCHARRGMLKRSRRLSWPGFEGIRRIRDSAFSLIVA
jgi:hypothetical protein